MVPHLTTALTGPLLELDANFLATALELRRAALMEEVPAEEEQS
jgi:hypothetical protein